MVDKNVKEDGERSAGQRRTGPNPGPYPWPGPGPGPDVLEDAARSHLRKDHHKRNTSSCHHYPLFERSRDLTSFQTRPPDTDNHHLLCHPYKTPTSPPEPFLKSPGLHADRNTHKTTHGFGHSSRVSPEKLRGSSGTRHPTDKRTHGHTHHSHHIRFKHHPEKLRDPLAFPLSVHPVQPYHLRCNPLNRELVASYRKLLNGEAVKPKSRSRSVRQVCAEASNPDIKTAIVDEACATTLSDADSTPKGGELAELVGNLALVKTQGSLSGSTLQIDGDPTGNSTEDSLIRIQGNYASYRQVLSTAPGVEKYTLHEDGSIHCSIHTCGISSTVSGATTGQEMVKCETRPMILDRSVETQDTQSCDKIETELVSKIPMLSDEIQSEHSFSYSPVSLEPSSDEYDSDENCRKRYLRDSCNDSDDNIRYDKREVPTKRSFHDDVIYKTSELSVKTPDRNEKALNSEKTTELNENVTDEQIKTLNSVDKTCKPSDETLEMGERISVPDDRINPDDKTSAQCDKTPEIDEETTKLAEKVSQIIGKTPYTHERDVKSTNREQVSLPVLEQKSPFAQTVDNRKASAGKSEVILVSRSLYEDRSEEIHFKVKSDDSVIDIRKAEENVLRNFGRASKIILTNKQPSTISTGSQTDYVLENFSGLEQNGHERDKTIRRRNTFPQVNRDWDLKKDAKSISEVCKNDAEIIEDLNVSTTASCVQEYEPIRNSPGKNGAISTSNAECQVNLTYTEVTEPDSVVSETQKDEFSTNMLDLICAHGLARISLDTLQSKEFQEENCQASLNSFQQYSAETVSHKSTAIDAVVKALEQQTCGTLSVEEAEVLKARLPTRSLSDSLQNKSSSSKISGECQTSLPLSSSDNKKSDSTLRSKISSTEGQVIEVDYETVSSDLEQSVEVQSEELDKISPTEIRMKICSQDGHVCQVYGAYTDRADVSFEVLSYQSDSQNHSSPSLKRFSTTRVDTEQVSSGKYADEGLVSTDNTKGRLQENSDSVLNNSGKNQKMPGSNSVFQTWRCEGNTPVITNTEILEEMSSAESVKPETARKVVIITVSETQNNIQQTTEGENSQAIELNNCGMANSKPVPSFTNFRGSVAASLEKVESLKETRDWSISGGSSSDSEEPLCLAEQLHQTTGEDGSEESMTAKSVAELTEDVLPQSDRKTCITETADISEKMSSDKNMSEGSVEKITKPKSSNEKEVKTVVSCYSVQRSSSGVGITTLDDNCENNFVKISQMKGISKQMSILGNEVVMLPQLISKSDQLKPESAIPDDVSSNKSSASWETDKETLKSEGTSRRSGRVEWTISVKDENGVETQRSVDIITISDPNEQLERRPNDGIVESPCGTQVSVSSWGTRVLMHPPSSLSIETKDVSEIIDGDFYKDVCKTVDDNQTRTKFKRRNDKKGESRNRAHLVEEDEEMTSAKKPSMGSTKNILSDDHQRRCCRGKEEVQDTVLKCFCDVGNVFSGAHGVAACDEESNFEQYHSISDLCLSEFHQLANNFLDSDHSPEQSINPSLLNLSRFTPPNPSSWSTLRHRLTVGNVLTVPCTHSRTKYGCCFLHSDEDIHTIRNRKPGSRESKRRHRRSDDFPRSSEDIRSRRSGRIMYEPDAKEEFSGAESNHRVVTFEDTRSTVRRSVTPKDKSIQAFEMPPSPDPGYADLQAEDLFRQGRSRNRYYEEVLVHEKILGARAAERVQTICPKMLSPRTSSVVQTNPVASRSHPDLCITSSKTTLLSLVEAGVYSASRLSSPTPSDIPSPPPNPSPNQLNVYPSRCKVDVAVGVGTLDSEAVLPASGDEIPTTIQVPISPTGIRHGSFSSANTSAFHAVARSSFQGIVPIAVRSSENKIHELGVAPIFVPSKFYQTETPVSRGVGVTTKSTHVIASPIPRDRLRADKESVTTKSTHVIASPIPRDRSRADEESVTTKSNHVIASPTPRDRSRADKEGVTTKSTHVIASPIRRDRSRADEESVTTKSTHVIASPTPRDRSRADEERVTIHRQSRGTSCCDASRVQPPPAVTSIEHNSTTIRKTTLQKQENKDEIIRSRGESKDSVAKETSAEVTTNPKTQRPVLLNGHYRFGSPNLHCCQHSDLIGEIDDVKSAVPSRMNLSHSPLPTNRLSPNIMVGCHSRLGLRILVSSASRNDFVHTNIPEPFGCHRESASQNPRSTPILRPADASCRSLTPTETADTNQLIRTADASQRTQIPAKDPSKRPLPPAALDLSEESWISKDHGSFSNAGVSKNQPSEIRNDIALGEPAVRFSTSEFVLVPVDRAGSGCVGTRGRSLCHSTPGTGSMSYPGAPNSSVPSTGRSLPDSFRESTCEDVLSLSRQEGSTSPGQPHQDVMNHSAIRSGSTLSNCPDINIQKDKIYIAIKASNSGPLFRAAAKEMVTPEIPESRSDSTGGTRISDATSDTRRSRGTLTDRIKESLVRLHGAHVQKSSSHSLEKAKSSTKSVHKTGSRTRHTVPNHVIRCTPASSKTTQSKRAKSIMVTMSSSAVEITSHPTLAEDQISDPWVPYHGEDDGGEASYIEEESENTDNVPLGRLQRESITGLQPVNNLVGTEAHTAGSIELARGATPGPNYLEAVYAPGLREPYGPGESAESEGFEPRFPSSRQDAALFKARDELRETSAKAGKERTRQVQRTGCVGDTACKNGRQTGPGNRYGLYTTRVGYIGSPPPLFPNAETTSRHVKRPLEPTPGVSKFQSKFHHYVRHQFYKNKKPHQTMGVAELPPELPNDFVKKQSKARGPVCPVSDKDVQFPFILARPDGIPKQKCKTIYDEARGKAPFKEEKCERDYIQKNIQNACQAVPLRRPARFVDTVHGHTQLMERSGLEPRFVFRKGYGEVPAYLSQVDLQTGTSSGIVGGRSGSVVGGQPKTERNAVVIRGSADNERQRHPLRYITEPERAQLIEGLKQNWQELTTIFQGLPMMTDTIAKMKRKETLENELRQLEKDIAAIEQNPIIYINQGAGDACDAAHIWVD